MGFCSLWSFLFFLSCFVSFFFSLFYNFNFFKPTIFFLHLFLCLPSLLFFSPYSSSLMYINLLHLPLFNFAYLFFLSFLSFISSQHICEFCFHCFITQLAPWLVLFSSLCFNKFCSGRYNFRFSLFTGSIYYTLFLLNCFDFVYGCVCIYFIILIIICLIL